MAIIHKETIKINKNDVLVEFIDSETKITYYKQFSFVSQKEIEHDLQNRINNAIANITAKIAQSTKKQDFTRIEIENILKEKGYLSELEKFEDLADKETEIKT